jgi:uncharacterized protein YlxW (UPF0749 family)
MPTPEEPYDAEASMIRKVLKSGIVEKLVPLLVSALLGGTAGMASRQVGDANEHAAGAAAREKMTELSAEFEKFRADYWKRQREMREVADEEHKSLEREQNAAERYLERRLTRIETKLGLEAPPSALASPALEEP